MSTKTPYRVMHMTRLRLGKSMYQVQQMISGFNPNIHSHIEIKVQASDEITYLEQQLAKKDEIIEELKSTIVNISKVILDAKYKVVTKKHMDANKTLSSVIGVIDQVYRDYELEKVEQLEAKHKARE